MPVGAWGGRDELMELYEPVTGPVIAHSGTFNANPISMVAGKTVLENLTESDYSRMNRLGGKLRNNLSDIFFR